MADINMPTGSAGGLMRYKEEYDSKFKFSPGAVIVAVIVGIAFVLILRWVF